MRVARFLIFRTGEQKSLSDGGLRRCRLANERVMSGLPEATALSTYPNFCAANLP